MAKIVYRVVSGLLALAVIPIAVFSPLIRFVGSVSLSKYYIGEDVSIWSVYNLFFRGEQRFSGFGENASLSDEVRSVLPHLITSGVCFALVLIISLVIIGFAAFSNKRAVITSLSGGALALIIAMFISFGNFASPFLDGTIKMSDLGLIESGILNTIADSFVSLKVLQISSAGFLIAIVYVAILIWGLTFILTEVGAPDKKKAH